MRIGNESSIFSLRNIRLGKTNMSAQTRLVNSSNEPWFNVFGPLHQYLVAPADVSGAFARMRAIIAPGIAIPLHSHADPEVFFILESTLEFLQQDTASSRVPSASSAAVNCIRGGITHI